MLIGAHVSVAGGVHNAVDRQLDVDGNCGQIFTHSPQVWDEPTIEDDQAQAFREETAAELEGPWVIHGCYLLNFASPKDDLREKSIANVQAELNAAAVLDVPYVNVHLGAHTGAGEKAGLENVIDSLGQLDIPEGVTLVLETDAGSGTKLGGEFEHLATVLEASDQPLAACLDTAHTFAAGYDISDPEAVDETVSTFDEVVGLEHLVCLHLNDSKHGCGTNKDEHAHVGEGEIGVDGMRAILTHPDLADLPYILETPTEDGKDFAWNIERAKELRDGV